MKLSIINVLITILVDIYTVSSFNHCTYVCNFSTWCSCLSIKPFYLQTGISLLFHQLSLILKWSWPMNSFRNSMDLTHAILHHDLDVLLWWNFCYLMASLHGVTLVFTSWS